MNRINVFYKKGPHKKFRIADADVKLDKVVKISLTLYNFKHLVDYLKISTNFFEGYFTIPL